MRWINPEGKSDTTQVIVRLKRISDNVIGGAIYFSVTFCRAFSLGKSCQSRDTVRKVDQTMLGVSWHTLCKEARNEVRGREITKRTSCESTYAFQQS